MRGKCSINKSAFIIKNKTMAKYIKGDTFEFGLIASKESKLLKNYDKRFYFVSDAWTTTRYPRTRLGLMSAMNHIRQNKGRKT